MQSQVEEGLFARACALAQVAPLLQALEQAANAPDTGDIYLVGGSVRDLMLDRDFVDIDVAIEGDAQALARALGQPHATETRFGTQTVVRDGLRYDLARTRAERYPHPGALPEVEPASIDADLVMVGTHDHKGISRWVRMKGSTAPPVGAAVRTQGQSLS